MGLYHPSSQPYVGPTRRVCTDELRRIGDRLRHRHPRVATPTWKPSGSVTLVHSGRVDFTDLLPIPEGAQLMELDSHTPSATSPHLVYRSPDPSGLRAFLREPGLLPHDGIGKAPVVKLRLDGHTFTARADASGDTVSISLNARLLGATQTSEDAERFNTLLGRGDLLDAVQIRFDQDGLGPTLTPGRAVAAPPRRAPCPDGLVYVEWLEASSSAPGLRLSWTSLTPRSDALDRLARLACGEPRDRRVHLGPLAVTTSAKRYPAVSRAAHQAGLDDWSATLDLQGICPPESIATLADRILWVDLVAGVTQGRHEDPITLRVETPPDEHRPVPHPDGPFEITPYAVSSAAAATDFLDALLSD